jgi:hypothetical protein
MLSRADCLANKVLKEDTKDADGNDLSEAVLKKSESEIIQMIMESPKLGLGLNSTVGAQ